MSGEWFAKRRGFERETPFDDLMEELRRIRFAIETNDTDGSAITELRRATEEMKSTLVQLVALQSPSPRAPISVRLFLALIVFLLLVLVFK
jgi:hypothetical protein